MKYWLAIISVVIFFSVNAQEQEQEVIDGKVFLVHIVEGGNTLFGLHRKYDVAVDDIIKYNPTVSDGLQIGQRILIPSKLVPPMEVKEPQVHVVKARETLFGISRQYNVSVDDLLKANPTAEAGLQVGQEIIISGDESVPSSMLKVKGDDTTKAVEEHIPTKVYQVTHEDSIVKYTVQQGETLYSIAKRYMVSVEKLIEVNRIQNNSIKPGDILEIPLKKERTKSVEHRELWGDSVFVSHDTPIKPKSSYKVVLLLPLKINANAQILSGMYDERTRLNELSDIALDFLLGAEMALDSLEKLGLNAEVHVFDTEGSLTVTKALTSKSELQTADVIIGPFFPENIEYMAQWTKEHRKKLIVPVSASAKVLENNPFVTTLVPSDLTMIGGMAKHLAIAHSQHNVQLVKGRNKVEEDRIAYFKEVYEANLPARAYRNKLKIVELGSSSGRELARLFDLDTVNIFVNLSSEDQGVMQFINTLNAAKNHTTAHGKASLIAYGLRDWMNVSALNSYYRNRFNIHFVLPNQLDYNEPVTFEMVKQFRERYKVDPSRFAFQGFDVAFMVGNELLLRNKSTKGYINHFNIHSVGTGHGKENATVFIVKQDDYELILVNQIAHSPFKIRSVGQIESEELKHENGN